MDLPREQIERYARQMILPEVGVAGQKKLHSARVVCVGAGGLGSPVALYLAAAGIGTIGLIDADVVDETNLQRQILYSEAERGEHKTRAARARLESLNRHVNVVEHSVRLDAGNALEILASYDIVVDGTDNLPTRYLVNDACVLLKKPNVYGAILRYEGQASLFAPHLGGPCYRCLYPEPPPPEHAPSCAEAGVIGVIPGLIGCIQATETLKLALGVGTSLVNRLLLVDALGMQFRELKVRRDPRCPVCGDAPTIRSLKNYAMVCAQKSPSDQPDAALEVTVRELKRAMDAHDPQLAFIDVRTPEEAALARIEGTVLIPLDTLASHLAELDPNRTYYVHCKAGGRSLRAVRLMRERGIGKAYSVRGGIHAWAEEIDPSVPRY